VILNWFTAFQVCMMIAIQMMIILGWRGFPPNVVKPYSDVSEEVTASLFRVTRIL